MCELIFTAVEKGDILRKLKRNTIFQDSHWIYTGIPNRSGYGQIKYKNKNYAIHRLSAYFYLKLNINNTKALVCHKRECNKKCCWNPAHLYIGDHSSNLNDAIESGDTLFSKTNKLKTHCPKGHEYTKENTQLDKLGYRKCKQCKIRWR